MAYSTDLPSLRLIPALPCPPPCGFGKLRLMPLFLIVLALAACGSPDGGPPPNQSNGEASV